MRSKKAIAVLGVAALTLATILGACGKAKVSSKSEGVNASGDASSSSSSSSSEKDLEPSDSAKDAVGGFDATNSTSVTGD